MWCRVSRRRIIADRTKPRESLAYDVRTTPYGARSAVSRITCFAFFLVVADGPLLRLLCNIRTARTYTRIQYTQSLYMYIPYTYDRRMSDGNVIADAAFPFGFLSAGDRAQSPYRPTFSTTRSRKNRNKNDILPNSARHVVDSPFRGCRRRLYSRTF